MPIDFDMFGTASRLGGFRAGILRWPMWARYVLFVPMLPGILLLALSIVVFVASLVALFVLTAPVYSLLAKLFETKQSGPVAASPGSKRVEATVRDV